jgi:hypothetical protein
MRRRWRLGRKQYDEHHFDDVHYDSPGDDGSAIH